MLYKEGEHMENQVRDLRSALKLLKEIPGQLVETDVEVNPKAELAGVYRYCLAVNRKILEKCCIKVWQNPYRQWKSSRQLLARK